MTPYELAYEYTLYTNRCIFLTGKAGTGKTTFLRRIKAECRKQLMVVAPTGVAAINAEGMTIHSLFQLPPQLFLPTDAARRRLFAEMQMTRQKQRLLRQLELLVIDEVSMVRSDLLDAIDAVLRHVKRKHHLPFGGVQLVFIGDLYQLSPVAREEEWRMLQPYYQGPYFFQARVFAELKPVYIELDHVYRQSNLTFISVLNEVRSNTLTAEHLALLNARCQPAWQQREGEPFYITLSTHNRKVDEINHREMQKLLTRTYTYRARVKDNFPESMYPIEAELQLREGARVMFVKNDSSQEHRYYNGKLGVVHSLSFDSIVVECEAEDGSLELIEVHEETWENVTYRTRPGSEEIEPVVSGTFTHIPLRLAWAVTIHKAQGLTFDRVVIDAADAFASGQVYVALSRCRTLEGIVLLSPIPKGAMANAPEVVAFTAYQPTIDQLETGLSTGRLDYLSSLLLGLFDFRDSYMRVEQLLRFVEKATSFNLLEVESWLRPCREMLGEWQRSGERFQQQLRGVLYAQDIDWEYLQQRLQAAAAYYGVRMSQLEQTLTTSPADTGNSKDAKRYAEQLDELVATLHLQAYMIGQMAKQAGVEQYAEAKSHYVPLATKSQAAPKRQKTKSPRLSSSALKTLHAFSEGATTIAELCRVRKVSAATIVKHLVELTKAELFDPFHLTNDRDRETLGELINLFDD